jgi:hypothetical protein
MGYDHRPPDDPSRSGIKDILMPCLDLKAKGLILLTSMLGTVARVGKVQDMGARGDLYFADPQTRIKGLLIERHEAYRLWQHDARVRLRTIWLLRGARQLSSPYAPPRSSMNQQNVLRMDHFLCRALVAQV